MAKRKSWKPSIKQRKTRLERFIKKYGYDPRYSYRPHKTGIVGRPKKEIPYNKAVVKSANERLRKIEKVYNLVDDSNEYRMVKKYAIEYPKTKGKIYRVGKDDSIRFISEREFNKLSDKEKAYFNEVLNNFMSASTSTKQGIEEKYNKAYETFMEHYGTNYPNLTMDEYKDFFKTYRDLVSADKKNQFDYNVLVQSLEFIDIGTALNDNQLEQSMKYVATNRFNKIPKRYKLNN